MSKSKHPENLQALCEILETVPGNLAWQFYYDLCGGDNDNPQHSEDAHKWAAQYLLRLLRPKEGGQDNARAFPTGCPLSYQDVRDMLYELGQGEDFDLEAWKEKWNARKEKYIASLKNA